MYLWTNLPSTCRFERLGIQKAFHVTTLRAVIDSTGFTDFNLIFVNSFGADTG